MSKVKQHSESLEQNCSGIVLQRGSDCKEAANRLFYKTGAQKFCKINFIKKETPTQAFSGESEKFLRAPFPHNTSRWLLLTVAAPQEQDNNLQVGKYENQACIFFFIFLFFFFARIDKSALI